MERIKVGGLLEIPGLVLITFFSQELSPEVVTYILEECGKRGINIEYISESKRGSVGSVSFCVKSFDKKGALSFAKGVTNGEVEVVDDVCVIGIFGPHFREKPYLAGRMFRALSDEGVEFLSISTSISTCACVVREKDVERAKEALSKVFQIPNLP